MFLVNVLTNPAAVFINFFCTISDYTSSTLDFVFRGLDLVGGSVDLSTLSDAETQSIFIFVCAERSFLWNRIVCVMGL